MATRYHLINLTDGTKIKDYARKDTAIKAAEKDGHLAFQVQTDTGKVVYYSDNRPSEVEDGTAIMKGRTPVVYTEGAAVFFTSMSHAAVQIAERAGLSATIDNASRTIYLSGDKSQVQATSKAIKSMWAAAYDQFKDWKKETKEQRKAWYASNDGRREMLTAEMSFLATTAGNLAAEQDVL